MKQRAFIQKHIKSHTDFNYGKNGRANKRNRRLGYKRMRNRLKKETIQQIE